MSDGSIINAERFSDVGNAKRLVRLHGAHIVFVPEVGWLWFNGLRWIRDEQGELMRYAKDVPQSIIAASDKLPMDRRKEAILFALRSEQAPRLAATIELAKSEPDITMPYRDFDTNHWLVGVENGVLDLRDGKTVPPRSSMRITRSLGTSFQTSATCPKWMAFLHRIMAGDIGMIESLQRACGYSLTGSTSEQCIFINQGPGANGKSVFMRVLREVAKDYGADVAADTFLDRDRRDSSNDLARLAGVRFVCASEIDEGKQLAESLIKSITGGEAISARFLYREYFEFVPQFKVWIACNHKPRISGDDHGIWRRIRLIPFRVTIPPEEQDRELLDKLRAEMPGILNWMVEGAVAWQKHGLDPPAAVLNATATYKAESDAIGEWIDQRCVVADGVSIQAKLLYDDYAKFIGDRGSHPLSMKRWAQRMADRGFNKDEGRIVHYRGIRLCDIPTDDGYQRSQWSRAA